MSDLGHRSLHIEVLYQVQNDEIKINPTTSTDEINNLKLK